MISRPACALVAGTLTAALLGACSSGTATPTATGSGAGAASASANGIAGTQIDVLSLWAKGSPEGDALRRATDAFAAKTGAVVKIVDAGENLVDVYETSVAAGKEADVIFVNLAEKSTGWTKSGAAVPVGDYLTQWGLKDKVKPEAIAQWTTDGKVSGFPYSGFVWPVWFNKDLLTKAGVDKIPTTTDDLIAAAKKLKESGASEAISIGGNDWSGNKLFLQIIQSYANADAFKGVLAKGSYCADADVKKGVDLFVQLRDAGVFVKDAQGFTADTMNTTFYTKKAAIMPAGSWAFAKTPPDVSATTELSGFPIPAGSRFTKPTAYNGYTGVGIFLSPNGIKKLDAVKAYVQAMYAKEVLADFVSTANLVPAATVSGATNKDPLLTQAVSALGDKVEYAVMPDTYIPPKVADKLIKASSQAFTPGVDAGAICSAVDKAYQ